MNRTIDLSPVEPARLSLRHPLGTNLDLVLTIRDWTGAYANTATLMPQLALLPRSEGGTYAYDMEAYDPANGIARVSINGAAFTDRLGYNIEVYSRQPNPSGVGSDPPVPVALIAEGVMAMQGVAYKKMGPLGMISVPTVVGPAGAKGETGSPGPAGSPGMRGSIWTTGSGAPAVAGVVEGDMYLDEATGDVYRWSGTAWLRGNF
jgi:hypothetical protein